MQPTATVQGLPGKVSTLNTWFNVPGGALGRGFKHRLLPSPQPGDRDRDSSCSSKDCNVAPREVIEQLNHASGPSPGLSGSPQVSAPAQSPQKVSMSVGGVHLMHG